MTRMRYQPGATFNAPQCHSEPFDLPPETTMSHQSVIKTCLDRFQLAAILTVHLRPLSSQMTEREDHRYIMIQGVIE